MFFEKVLFIFSGIETRPVPRYAKVSENEFSNSDVSRPEHSVACAGSSEGAELQTIASSADSCAASLASIDHAQKNHMDRVTGYAALGVSSILLLMYYGTHLWNVTHGLPTQGLMTDVVLGFIVTPFGIKSILWMQKKQEENKK